MIFILTKDAKLTFPVTPTGIGPKGGDTQITEVQTLHRGVIPFTEGTGLEEVAWTSFFLLIRCMAKKFGMIRTKQ